MKLTWSHSLAAKPHQGSVLSMLTWHPSLARAGGRHANQSANQSAAFSAVLDSDSVPSPSLDKPLTQTTSHQLLTGSTKTSRVTTYPSYSEHVQWHLMHTHTHPAETPHLSMHSCAASGSACTPEHLHWWPHQHAGSGNIVSCRSIDSVFNGSATEGKPKHPLATIHDQCTHTQCWPPDCMYMTLASDCASDGYHCLRIVPHVGKCMQWVGNAPSRMYRSETI
jgi:hypothetical protein